MWISREARSWGEGGTGSSPGGAQAPDQPGGKPGGWVGRQISLQPGPGRKRRQFPPDCFLGEGGAEVIS